MYEKPRKILQATAVACVAFMAGSQSALAHDSIISLATEPAIGQPGGVFDPALPGIDALTGGDYRDGPTPYPTPLSTNYGSCFSVLSQASPRKKLPEVEIGPFSFLDPESLPADFWNVCSEEMIAADAEGCIDANPDDEIGGREFQNAVCITDREGEVTVGNPLSAFDFRFFKTESAGPGVAYAWSFKEFDGGGYEPGELIDLDASQWNECLDVQRGSTFDNAEFEFDPLSGVVDIQTGGDARVAFYFLTARNACRRQEWKLWIDEGGGEEAAIDAAELPLVVPLEGEIMDFAIGKYLVFDVKNIPPDGAKLRLETMDSSTDGENGPSIDCPTIAGATSAKNSHLSGIFVSGSTYCAPPDVLECIEPSVTKTTWAVIGEDDVELPTVENGINVEEDTPIYWTYEVENTIGVPVTFTLEDEANTVVVEVEDCDYPNEPSKVLQPGETASCILDDDHLAGQGPYTNTASVTFFTDPAGEEIFAIPGACEGSSEYFGVPRPVCKAQGVLKTTKAGNDEGDGLLIEVGTPVSWTYQVTNPFDFDVTFTLNDDKQGDLNVALACDRTQLKKNGDPADTATCTLAGGPAGLGDYENTATVVFTRHSDGYQIPNEGGSCTDDSSYTGVPLPICNTQAVDKTTVADGQNVGDGAEIVVNTPVSFNYEVTNPFDFDVTFTLSDEDNAGNVNDVVSCVPALGTVLGDGESATCTLDGGAAVVGDYSNTATVVFTRTDGTVIDNAPDACMDDSSYTGVDEPCLKIVKEVSVDDGITWYPDPTNPDEPQPVCPVTDGNNGNDPDECDFVYRFRVENCGGVDLKDVTVTDDDLDYSKVIGLIEAGDEVGLPPLDAPGQCDRVDDSADTQDDGGLNWKWGWWWQGYGIGNGNSNDNGTPDDFEKCNRVVVTGCPTDADCEVNTDLQVEDEDEVCVTCGEDEMDVPEVLTCRDLKDVTGLTMIWNGDDGVKLTTELGQVIDGVNNGDVISFDTPRDETGNNVLVKISGAVTGKSVFNISCSDKEMNGYEDCGLPQGNGKKNKAKFLDYFLFAGMIGEKGQFTCDQ